MLRRLFIAIIILAAAPSWAVSTTPPSFADLVEKLTPAVVNISTTQKVKGYNLEEFQMPAFPPGSPFEEFNELFRQHFDGQGQERRQMQKATSLGSGFIIDPGGVIVTNNHVVADAEEITVTLSDNSKLKAKILGRDTKLDVALLKVSSPKPLPYAEFGDSDSVRVGDWVIAIGNPYGLGGTVTAGIISARGRDINIGPFDDFLQTDAAINRGNSGGPMFNAEGKVIGINTAIFAPSGGGNVGIGFAMPAALLKPVIDQLKTGGKVRRGWLGVKIQTVTDDIAESLGLKKEGGALVLEINKGSPAEKAGIKIGDVITRFDGQEVAAMRRLPRIVAGTGIGKKVPVEIFRAGESKTVEVTLGELKEEAEKPQKASSGQEGGKDENEPGSKTLLGMKLVPVTQQIKESYGIKFDGLLVLSVSSDSGAAERLMRGDVIIKAGGAMLKSVAELEAVIKAAKAGGRKSVLLLVGGANGEARFVPLAAQ